MKSAEYNDDELKNLAPKLASIGKKEVFSVPGNYFDSLSDQIMDKVSVTPQFEDLTVSNPFAVPVNYFEGLPLDVIKRVEASQAKRFSLAGLLAQALRPKYSLTLITACFTLFLCIRFFEKPITMNVSQTASDNVSITETDVLVEVDESTIMSVAAEESAAVLKNNNLSANGDKNIEDYIINNNIDISDVVKEL